MNRTFRPARAALCCAFACLFCAAVFAAKTDADREKNLDTLRYGLESDITELVSKLARDKVPGYTEELLGVFKSTKSVAVRDKLIEYFTTVEDKSLADYAVSILEDPYDEKKTTVNLIFKYISDLKIHEAAPAVRLLLENGNEDYQTVAIRALGKIGSADDAVFLTEYLDQDLPVTVKQALVSALGELKAVETWDKLVEIAQNSDENSFMRTYAAEAIGQMEKPESVAVLTALFEESDPNLRSAVIRGLAHFDVPESRAVIIEAFRDGYYKVRLEAAAAAEKLDMKEAVPYIIYRAKNDPEKVVKTRCYESLGVLNTKEGSDYLLSVVNDEKMNEALRTTAASVLLKYDFDRGIDDILKFALSTLKDDSKKNMRYALGKELARYESPKLQEVCALYIQHKDVSTKGIGLDIYAKNRFSAVTPLVEAIAADEKAGSLRTKAKSALK